ncbi:unnamed protein product [Effrenium voratum]|uniref:Uncharacterized protein n=1 Tax=Effrenium voratum TaxID=2562239 RepID=A0AA36IIR8_9DINO|nr:unnamed protein product [Effrenium voratum]CAJ1388085.1 unnamed protein product [Effrenium voratum]CAJ1444610.1 unnamed protein product [Effrenium voratum]
MARFAFRNLGLFARGAAAVPAVAWHRRVACEPTQQKLSAQVPETISPWLQAALHEQMRKQGESFEHTFAASKNEFDDAWVWSWALLGAFPANRSSRHYERRRVSTADSANRFRDKSRVESKWGLCEFGGWAEFYDGFGDLIACGYEAVVYGDHGPYVEFKEEQLQWAAFTRHKLKGPGRTHMEHYNADESVKVYDQFRTVANQPNPPPDNEFSCANNRPEGYADYRPGRIYMSCDAFFASGGKLVLPVQAEY